MLNLDFSIIKILTIYIEVMRNMKDSQFVHIFVYIKQTTIEKKDNHIKTN
jgi:hypothetical protein